ncbi:MAG: RimK family alpha-L-glutamate ligase [Desulfatiglandales bacterium]
MKRWVALGKRLSGADGVITLGVKPNFYDYSPEERGLILNSDTILYPTTNYAQFFHTMGKRIFPSLETYLYSDDKIKQTSLFYILGLRHPKTRFYFGRQKSDILRDFDFPFIGKLPRASAGGRGVFLIGDENELDNYLKKAKVAYIQEYIPHERDIRVILIGYEPILAYWRIPKEGFKTNLIQGASFSFEDIPPSALEYAIYVSKACRFNDVGLDLLPHRSGFYILEANMHYGRRALNAKGMDLKRILLDKLDRGVIP